MEERLEKHRDFLVDRIDPDYGLLDKLLASKTITRETVHKIKLKDNTTEDKNRILLGFILWNKKVDELISCLRDSGQIHLVNYLNSDGEHEHAFGDDWPLSESDISRLEINHESLVDLLDTRDLCTRLFSEGVINNRQNQFISSKPTIAEKNEALLDILTKCSIRQYNITIACLSKSNQNHIAEILSDGGVLVRVHANLEGTVENVDELEEEIISQFTRVLETHSLEEVDRLLSLTQQRIIAARKGHSIVIYILCTTNDVLLQLIDQLKMDRLKEIIERIFRELVSMGDALRVVLTWSVEEFKSAATHFASRGVPSAISNRNGNQPPSLKYRVEEDTVKMMDVQTELTQFIEQYVMKLSSRISVVEHELGNDQFPIAPSHSVQSDALPRSEATALDRNESKHDSLKQQVLRLQTELSNMNARVKELEQRIRVSTAPSHLDCFKSNEDSIRNLVRVELDAILAKKKLVQDQEASFDETPSRCVQRNTSHASTFTTWSREEKSIDESEERKVLDMDYDKATVGQASRGVPSAISNRDSKQPPSLESRVEEDSGSESTLTGTQHTVSTRTLGQPGSLEGMLEGDASENTDRKMPYAASSRTIDQLKSLEGQLEGDTDENTDRKMHYSSSRTIDQPMSLEGQLERDTGGDIDRKMPYASSSRTIDQPMSLEGQLQGDTGESTDRKIHYASSSRTIDQPMSLEGQLERDTGEDTNREMQDAGSTRDDLVTSLEGKLEGLQIKDASETKTATLQKSSGAKPNVFRIFQKKPPKNSKVPDPGDPNKPQGAGPSGASKVKESSKGKKS